MDLTRKVGRDLILQVFRFCIVGLTAAVIHYSIVVELVQRLTLNPLIANVFGFIFAFQVSYWGHRLWTFNGTLALHRAAFPKLLLIQVTNFIANEALFSIFLSWGLPYNVALLIVLAILPIFTFVSSKMWVFR